MKNYIDLEDMVNTNCSNVLAVIQANESISRKKITELTGLSWGGMTKIVNKLLENEYITEEKRPETAKSGRTPGVISVNKQKNYVVGLDINKIGFRGTVMNLAGEALKSYSSEVCANTKDQLLEEIICFIKTISKEYTPGIIIAIGIAIQGIVDTKNGISVKFPGIDNWKNVPIKDILSEKFNVNVFIEHDPDCLLYTHMVNEYSKNISLFRLDKSIGMAVSLNGKLLKSKGILEIAHNIVIPNGKACFCGLKGCLQAYIPSSADKSKAIDEFLYPLAVTIKNTVNIFNSDTVILTGDLVPQLISNDDKILKYLKALKCNVVIKYYENADNAVLGAALIAINKSINSIEI